MSAISDQDMNAMLAEESRVSLYWPIINHFKNSSNNAKIFLS